MNIITVNGKDGGLIKNEIFKMISDLESKLKIRLTEPIIVNLHLTRADYEKVLRKNTQEWEVGNTSKNNVIDILHPDSFSDFSSHNKEEFYPILKHELAHIYIRKLSENKTVPMWLNEGLAMCIAGQVPKYQNSEPTYVERRYLEKLSTQYGWDKHAHYSGYKYSCLFVNYLINKYSISLVIGLIKSSKTIFDVNSFDNSFSKIYGLSLEKAENSFIEATNNIL